MPDIAAPTIPTYLFDHNWRQPPGLSSEFEVQIDHNTDATEQRRSLRGKPRRSMSRTGLTLEANDAARLLLQMKEASGGRLYHPLYPDESILTATAAMGAGTLECDVDDRRFFAGHDVLVIQWGTTKRETKIERHTIDTVNASSLDLVGTLAAEFDEGSSVYPCIIADINLQQTGRLENDSVFAFNADVREFIDANTLPPLVAAGAIPSDANSYKGLPVLDIPHHWQTTTEGVLRRGKSTEVGLGTVRQISGDDAFFTAQLAFQQHTRAEAFQLLRFFDSRAGSTFPFWYPLRSRSFTLRSKTVSALTVDDSIAVATPTPISIWLKDGTVLIRFVTGVLSAGGNKVLFLNENVTEGDDEIERVSFAALARFAQDAINEQWRSLTTLEAGLSIQELPFSGDITCSGEDCEDGGCHEEDDCEDPEPPTDPEPPDDPWEPGDECENGTATVPMYFDLTQTWNSGREPIRAGDLNLPDEFVVNIKNGFEIDATHPQAPGSLSDELIDALFRPHVMAYAGTLTRSGSRNPYHYKITGTGPYNWDTGGASEAVEDSPYWESVVNYTVDETEYTLTVRLYVEWVDQTDAGGDSGDGAWGAMFVLWAWTDEIGSYTEDTNYAPFDDIAFNFADPFVGGLYESEAAANKYAHPLALFMAMCPTTFHVPIGYDFHSLLDRDQYLHECFASDPGAPWSNGTITDAFDNACFGEDVGSVSKRALGALGGWTSSEFFNWVCVENEAGSGMTILKPTRPGWDEDTATLTPGSADISIDLCTPPQTAIDPCVGHPDDPLEGRGGTHVCWRDDSLDDATEWICLSTTAVTRVTVNEKCLSITGQWDGACDLTEVDCDVSTLTTNFNNVTVEDYGYNFGGSQSARFIDLRQYEDDPDYVRQNWPQVECDTAGSYWDDDVGSSVDSIADCGGDPVGEVDCTPTTGKTVNLVVAYDPPSVSSIEDGSIGCEVTLASDDQVGLGMRVATSGGDITEGYVGIVDETNQKVILYLVDGTDSLSVIDEVNAVIPTGVALTLTLTSLGHDHTFRVMSGETVLGTASVTGECTYQSGGEPAVVSLSDSAFTAEDVTTSDNNWQKLTVAGDINDTAELVSSANDKLCKGYTSTCEGCDPEDCPGALPPCNGPCSATCKSIDGVYSVTYSNYPSGVTEPHLADWHPPTDVGPCEEADPSPPCGDCPPPYEAYIWDISGNTCGDNDDNESIWIDGLSAWDWDEVVVP